MKFGISAALVLAAVIAPAAAFAQSAPPATSDTSTENASTSVAAAPPVTTEPVKQKGVHYIAGDVIVNPSVYNQYNAGSPGALGGTSYGEHGAIELNWSPLEFIHQDSADVMIAADAHQYFYPHLASSASGAALCGTGNAGCVTNPGQTTQSYVPSFTANDNDYSVHLGVGSSTAKVYLAGSYMQVSNNYGLPTLQGFGFGVQKLADVNHEFAPYASVYYYPTIGSGTSLQYGVLSYQAGIDVNMAPVGIPAMFFDFGFQGDRSRVRSGAALLAASDFQHAGAYAGVGLKF